MGGFTTLKMKIYSRYYSHLAYFDTKGKVCGITSDIYSFFTKNRDILVTYNGREDKQRFPNAVIFSINDDATFVEYCAKNGLNICTNNAWRDRAGYDVTMLLEHYEEIIQPRFDLFTHLIKKYKLTPMAYRWTNTQILREVLGWK